MMQAKQNHQDIPLAVVGCDFRTARQDIRSMLISTEAQRKSLTECLRGIDRNAGFAALETCNRVEWIVAGENPGWIADILHAQFIARWEEARLETADMPDPYRFTSEEAAMHAFRVTTGLESLAAGEAQIAGQMQRALDRARNEKTTNIILNGLSSSCGRIAKAASRLGFRSNHRIGIHGMAVKYVQELLLTLDHKNVAVIGMGNIGRKAAALLHEISGCKVFEVNRTVQSQHQKIWYPMENLPEILPQIDAAIIATGAMNPVLKADTLQNTHRSKPLIILDIGVPKQVDSELIRNSGVFYRNIDDLISASRMMNQNTGTQRLIRELSQEIARFRRFCLARDMVALLDTIHQTRSVFISEAIPAFLSKHLSESDSSVRKTVEQAMKQMIREYSNDIFMSINTALEDYRSAV